MGLEELIHVTALWIALFYAAATTAAIMRIEIIVGWDIWLWLALFSMAAGILMIGGLYYEPRMGPYSGRPTEVDYGAKKFIRICVCFFIILFISWPFGVIQGSPTPLADLLNLTLITYVWLLYVAIWILSIFYQRKPEEVIEE